MRLCEIVLLRRDAPIDLLLLLLLIITVARGTVERLVDRRLREAGTAQAIRRLQECVLVHRIHLIVYHLVVTSVDHCVIRICCKSDWIMVSPLNRTDEIRLFAKFGNDRSVIHLRSLF